MSLPRKFEKQAEDDFLLMVTRLFYDKTAEQIHPEVREHAYWTAPKTEEHVDFPVYVGSGQNLINFLKASAKVRKYLNITEVDEEWCTIVASPTDAGKPLHSQMIPDCVYALYIQKSEGTKAVAKPLKRFLMDSSLDMDFSLDTARPDSQQQQQHQQQQQQQQQQ